MKEIKIEDIELYCSKLISIWNGNTHWVCRVTRDNNGKIILESLTGGSSQGATKLLYANLPKIKILHFSELNTLDVFIVNYIKSLPKFE